MMLGAALSALILGAAAIHVVEDGAKKDEGGPHVMVRRVRGHALSAAPPQRVFVYGADAEEHPFPGFPVKPRYHHIAKTGITSIMSLLTAAMDNPKSWEKFPAAVGAFTKQPSDFYIASIRNPCNYYVSLWAYNAEHATAHVVKELAGEGRRFFSGLSEGKDSASDVEKFRGFVKLVSGDIGVLTGRLAHAYIPRIYSSKLQQMNFSTRWLGSAKAEEVKQRLGEFNNSQVDCWVSTETLAEDMAECMAKLSRDYGWAVNWEKFNSSLASLRKNPSNHKQCKLYYNNETEQLVRKKDSVVFDHFGFDTCCDAGSNLAAHLTRHTSA